MNIVFLGDIVSRVGREGVKKIIPFLRKKYEPDIFIANCENVSHGQGISKKHLLELKDAGIDFFTSGNHIWQRPDSTEILNESESFLIRPANYPEGVPGVGYKVLTLGKKLLGVINLQGRVFMKENISCPFLIADKILDELIFFSCDSILVDFHTETTSEKVALGWYLDGRVAAVVGTHTHIQTADEKILPKKTAYITDVGGCYAADSVIGVNKENVLDRFIRQSSCRFSFPQNGKCVINGVYLAISQNQAKKIERISEIIEV